MGMEQSQEKKNSRFSLDMDIDCRHVDVVDGIRGLSVLMVLWFHFWQQTWFMPNYPTPWLRFLGITNLTASQLDATVFMPQWENQMDAVICDVPCSGYGIIRKKPDIRYKNLKEMEKLPALQQQILFNQARYVRPGGVLLYSTCTLVREENEGMVEYFLQQHPEFYLEQLTLPDIFPVNETGMIALVPGEYDTDGFFIARLRRKSCT